MRPASILLALLLAAPAAGCSHDSPAPELTPTPAPISTPSATRPVATGGSGAAIAPARLEPASADVPPDEPGTYLLDTRTLALFRASVLLKALWAPGGRILALSHCCTNDGFIDLLDVASGSSRRVATGDTRDLAWSPDGSKLAYVPMNEHQQGTGVRVMQRDGSGVRALVTHQGAGEPRWLDENRIAYSVGVANVDEPSFYVVSLDDPGQARQLRRTEPPDALDPRIVFGSPSADGDWVVYFDGPYRRGEGASFAWNRATRGLVPLLPRLLLAEWAANTHQALLFSIERPEGLGLVEAIDLDTGMRSRIPGGFESRWAADARTVVHLGYQCSRGAPLGETDVFATLPGAPPRNISATPGEVEYALSTSPAANTIAYAAFVPGPAASWRLTIRDFDGGPPASVALALPPQLRDGAWSAEGRYLVFTLGAGGNAVCA